MHYDEVWIIGSASMHANGEINIDEMCITTMEGVTLFFPLHYSKKSV